MSEYESRPPVLRKQMELKSLGYPADQESTKLMRYILPRTYVTIRDQGSVTALLENSSILTSNWSEF